MSVLLIGSTGMGKSTLANFLYNPGWSRRPKFAMSTDSMPCTARVQVETTTVSADSCEDLPKFQLTIIDTPGLNEGSHRANFGNMIEIIQRLKRTSEVKACIFVVKFDSRVDAQYKATLQYYSKLLPNLFERNVIVVMTEFRNDEYSAKLRERRGTNVERIKHQAMGEIRAASNISFVPQIFTIDCLPFEEELEENLRVRDAIIHYIYQLKAIAMDDVKVVKTPFVREYDLRKMKEHEGEINGYAEMLKEVNAKSKQALNKVREKEEHVTIASNRLQNLKCSLEDKDTADFVVAATWSIEESWGFRRLQKDFQVESQWEIKDYVTWSNGHCSFIDIHQDTYEVTGKVKGEFMRGLYASVELFTEKRLKYATEIEKLKREVKKADSDLTKSKKACERVVHQYNAHKKQIEQLQAFIQKKREKIKLCSADILPVDEALKRLEEIPKDM